MSPVNDAAHATSALWRWVDRPGHDAARAQWDRDGFRIQGVSAFAEAGLPVVLEYFVSGDAAWRSNAAEVRGWIGPRRIDVEIARDPDGLWTMNGETQPHLAECVDVDLNFSPSTNLLPIRRLSLEAGQEGCVRAAWLRFPSMTLEVLEQTYRRIDAQHYEYRSSSFRATIRVNASGMALDYAGVWIAEAES